MNALIEDIHRNGHQASASLSTPWQLVRVLVTAHRSGTPPGVPGR
ncbi:hypothetical protein ABT297_16725 [Dactylosporangium sp. NPDC000555]